MALGSLSCFPSDLLDPEDSAQPLVIAGSVWRHLLSGSRSSLQDLPPREQSDLALPREPRPGAVTGGGVGLYACPAAADMWVGVSSLEEKVALQAVFSLYAAFSKI